MVRWRGEPSLALLLPLRSARTRVLLWWPCRVPGAGAPGAAGARAPQRPHGRARSRLRGARGPCPPAPGATWHCLGSCRRSGRPSPSTALPAPGSGAPAGSPHTRGSPGPWPSAASASPRRRAWQPLRERRSVPPSRAVDARRPGHALQDGVGYGAPTPQGVGIGQNRGPNAAGRGEALRLSNTWQVAVGWRGGPDHDAGGTGGRPSRPGRVVAR